MVTVNNIIGEHAGTAEFEFKGLHADTKPTEEVNGKKVGVNSLFFELDTGDLYYYTGEKWEAISMSGSGGGGGQTAEVFYVDFELGDETATTETSTSDIIAAYEAGRTICARFGDSEGYGMLNLTFIGDNFIMFSGCGIGDGPIISVIYSDGTSWEYHQINLSAQS